MDFSAAASSTMVFLSEFAFSNTMLPKTVDLNLLYPFHQARAVARGGLLKSQVGRHKSQVSCVLMDFSAAASSTMVFLSVIAFSNTMLSKTVDLKHLYPFLQARAVVRGGLLKLQVGRHKSQVSLCSHGFLCCSQQHHGFLVRICIF